MSFLKTLFRKNKSVRLTSPFDPKPELQSENGVRDYLSNLSKLNRTELCIEFANVRAAKHNLMMLSGDRDFQKTQAIVTDLTDKSTAICIFAFGQSAVLGYAGGRLNLFNELINNIDDEIAQLGLEKKQHGELLLSRIREYLKC